MRVLPLFLLFLTGCFYGDYGYRPVPPPLTPLEVETMASAGISEPTIVEIVQERGAVRLSSDDIVALKKSGASDQVIASMQNSVRPEPEAVYAEGPDDYYSPYYDGPYWGYPWWGWSYSYWGRGPCWSGRSSWGGHSSGGGRRGW